VRALADVLKNRPVPETALERAARQSRRPISSAALGRRVLNGLKDHAGVYDGCIPGSGLSPAPDPLLRFHTFVTVLRRADSSREWTQEVTMIRKEKAGYKVISEKGKNLGGPYRTKDEAEKRLRQVEFFKHRKG
jgi:hypothetical protein